MSEKPRLIQLVKIAQKQLAMDDDSYRAMLKRLTNKTSATKCTIVELHRVIHELKQKGAKIASFTKNRKNLTAYSPATGSQLVKSEVVHKIRAVWINMGKDGFLKDPSEKALNAYMRKVINKNRKVLALNVASLTQTEASRLLEILKNWHKRLMLQSLVAMGCLTSKEASYDEVVEQFSRYYRFSGGIK